MRKFLFLFIVFLSLFIYGGSLNLKVVYEKTFDEPILDVIFDTVTVSIEEAKSMGWKEEAFTEEGKGKVLVSYPKVVLISRGRELDWYVPERRSSYYTKEIRFYDRDGKIINRLPLKEFGEEYVYLSPQQKYILIANIPTEWAPGYSGGILYDLNGNKIWEIEGPTPIAVSDEGYAVAAYLDWDVPPKPGGDFYVYDSKGKLLTKIENPLKEKTAPLFAKYSKDGEYGILCFKATTYPPTVFVLITKEGKILWEKELLEYRFPGRSEEIDILPEKGIGVVAFFIDWQGNIKKWKQSLNINTAGNRSCIFSQDGEKFYLSTTFGYLWCYNVNNSNMVWMYKEDWAPLPGNLRPVPNAPKFTEIYENSKYLVVKGNPSTIFIFDSATGKLRKEIEYSGTQIFLASDNGKIFVIDTKNKKILGHKIEEE